MDSNDGDLMDIPSADGADWLLQNILGFAKAAGTEFPITLTVQGVVISGLIVSPAKYNELLVEQLGAGGGSANQTAAKWMADFSDALQRDDAQGDGPYFVHLARAAYVTPQGFIPTAHNMIWRGKVSDVSGFSIGSSGVR